VRRGTADRPWLYWAAGGRGGSCTGAPFRANERSVCAAYLFWGLACGAEVLLDRTDGGLGETKVGGCRGGVLGRDVGRGGCVSLNGGPAGC